MQIACLEFGTRVGVVGSYGRRSCFRGGWVRVNIVPYCLLASPNFILYVISTIPLGSSKFTEAGRRVLTC